VCKRKHHHLHLLPLRKMKSNPRKRNLKSRVSAKAVRTMVKRRRRSKKVMQRRRVVLHLKKRSSLFRRFQSHFTMKRVIARRSFKTVLSHRVSSISSKKN
jgi:hypothetical protein